MVYCLKLGLHNILLITGDRELEHTGTAW